MKKIINFMIGAALLFSVCGALASCALNPKYDGNAEIDGYKRSSICSESEMKNLKTVVKNEDSFKKMLEESSVEVKAFSEAYAIKENPQPVQSARTAAKTPAEAAVQISEYMRALASTLNQFKDDMESVMDDMSSVLQLLDKTFKFDFDGSVDVDELTVDGWIEAFAGTLAEMDDEIINFEKELSEDESDLENKKFLIGEIELNPSYTIQDYKDKILEVFYAGFETEENGKTPAELFAILNKYITIKKFYLGTDVKANVNVGKIISEKDEAYLSEQILFADLDYEYDFIVKDINALVKEIIGSEENPECPLRGFSARSKAAIDLNVTGKNAVDWKKIFITPSLLVNGAPDIEEAKSSLSQEVVLAVCTESGLGGWFTIKISSDVNKDDVKSLASKMIVASTSERSDTEENSELENETLEILDDFVSVKITAADNKKVVWTKEMKLSELSKLMDTYFGDEPEPQN